MRELRIGVALMAALCAVTVASAQESRARGGTPGQFDFYVLALSWSPAFCDGQGNGRGSRQCESGRRLGFVTHGLWPQYERGYPSECGSGGGPPNAAMDEADAAYPDRGLARHEWRVHGTCSGLPPAEYFRTVRRGRDKVQIPDPLVDLAREGQTTPQNLERAFVAVNPGLRADMISLVCRRGALQEVRICLDRDLRGFRSCPALERSPCGYGPIRITAPR